MTDTEDRKSEEAPEFKNLSLTPSAGMPALIPPETLKGFLEVSESLRHFMAQNSGAFEAVSSARANYGEVFHNIALSASLSVSEILNAQMRAIELGKVFQSPALAIANEVNQSIGRLIDATGIKRINELIEEVVLPQRMWAEQLRAIENLVGGPRSYALALESHLAEISKLTVLSQATVSRLPWGTIGNALDLQVPLRNVLQDSFLDFARSYSRLFEYWEKQPSFVLSIPPVLSRFPAIEFFNGVDVVDGITIKDREDTELQEEKRRAKEDVRKETGDRLEALLVRLDAELVVPLRGARHSLDSTNPDHVRHFVVSLRELFTHVLHALAPTDKVKAWNATPEHYDNGRPTRRARLLYICRVLNQEPFSAFLEKDIDAGLEFLNLFQRGTHEVLPKYTDVQLRIMLVRMESLLRLLLEIWSTD